MAKTCTVCSKGYQKGHKISHAHNVSIKRWHPNLQKIRVVQSTGGTRRVWVCTSCIQKGSVTKRVA